MPRFKSNNLYQTRPKIKLLFQKNLKVFERWELAPRPPMASAGWWLSPIPQSTALSLQITGFASGW